MSVTFGEGPFEDGQVYVGSDGFEYCYVDGCFVIPRPEDINTQDGYSAPGLAPNGVVDFATGEPIEEGAPVTVFFDGDGQISGYKDCTDMDTFGVLNIAQSQFESDDGYIIEEGDQYLALPGGERICVRKTTDTFADLIVAGFDGVDDAGNEYLAGDDLIQLANGKVICAEKTVDTVDGYSVKGYSDGTQFDFENNPIPNGVVITTYFDSDGVELYSDYDKGSTTTPSADGKYNTIKTSDGGTTDVCLNPAKDLTQDAVTGTVTQTYADGSTDIVETKYSTTVPTADGLSHVITTDDGVPTTVCLNPLKSINGVGPDINGNVNVADLFSTTVDNGDGTYTTTNPDGTSVTWSGDTFASQMDNGDGTVTFTMADASTVTLCLNPVKSVVPNADGLGATVTYADGTVAALVYPTSTAASNGDGTTTTTHPDGTTHTSCDNPVKDVVDADGNTLVTDGVANLPPSGSLADNADGTANVTLNDANNPGTQITCAVPLQKQVKCDGTDRAKNEVIRSQTIDERIADGIGNYESFVEGIDACTPLDKTGCIDEAGFTVSPQNCAIWIREAGTAAYTKVEHNCDKWYGEVFILPENQSVVAPTDGIIPIGSGLKSSVTIENKDCVNRKYQVRMEEVHSENYYTEHGGFWLFIPAIRLDGANVLPTNQQFHRGHGFSSSAYRLDAINWHYFNFIIDVPPGIHTIETEVSLLSSNVTAGASLSWAANKWYAFTTAELIKEGL